MHSGHTSLAGKNGSAGRDRGKKRRGSPGKAAVPSRNVASQVSIAFSRAAREETISSEGYGPVAMYRVRGFRYGRNARAEGERDALHLAPRRDDTSGIN